MKKNKTMLLISLLALLATGCGGKTSETAQPTDSEKKSETDTEKKSDSSTVKTTDYYLAGNIDLGDDSEKKFNYDDTTKTYTLNGISLKRGDAFFVHGTEGLATISFDSLVSQNGFEKGNGNYISVLNEGIYDLAIKDGALSLAKTASNYHDVKIVYEDGKESLDFVMQDDFTFVLEDAPIRYRQKFYIDMDGEKLGFDSLGFNEAYYKAFRFDNNSIESIKKGNFDFTIDFSLKQPLVITSEEIQEENTAPVDGDAYYKYIKQFDDQFADKGSKFTMTSEVTSGDTVTKEVVEETLDLNQHYIQSETYSYSADQSKDDAITEEKGKEKSAIEKREAVFNSTNYYEIATFEGETTNKPIVDGALIQDEEDDTSATANDEESTMVYLDRKHVTKEKAFDKMISYQSEYKAINSYLSYMISHAHISGSSTLNDQTIKDNLQIEYEYLGDIGDEIKIKFTNYEMVYSAYGSSSYVTNDLEITVSEAGLLTDGVYKVNTYSGKCLDSDKKPVENLDTYLTKAETHTFHMDYEDRKEVTDFKISIEDNVASEVEAVLSNYECSSKVSSLKVSDIGLLSTNPAAPLDLGNYKIMAYDSKFFTMNYSKNLDGRGVVGTTVITVGNEYNMVTCDVNVTLTYEDYTNSSQFGNLYCNDKSFTGGYLGETYDLVLTPYSGYDPSDIEITASSDAITISDMNSDENKKATGKITFKLTMNKVEGGVYLKLVSKSKPSITKTISLTISEPWSVTKAAGVYCYPYVYNVSISQVTLNSDGSGAIRIGTFTSYTEYSFKYKIDSNGVISLVSSDTITDLAITMQASKSIYASSSEKVECKTIKVTKVVIDGSNKASSYNNTFNEVPPVFEGNKYIITDESSNVYTFVKSEMTSLNDGVIYFTDGKTVSKFTLSHPTSEYSYASYSASAEKYYEDSTSSSCTSNSGSYTYVSGMYIVKFGLKEFTFTPRS